MTSNEVGVAMDIAFGFGIFFGEIDDEYSLIFFIAEIVKRACLSPLLTDDLLMKLAVSADTLIVSLSSYDIIIFLICL